MGNSYAGDFCSLILSIGADAKTLNKKYISNRCAHPWAHGSGNAFLPSNSGGADA